MIIYLRPIRPTCNVSSKITIIDLSYFIQRRLFIIRHGCAHRLYVGGMARQLHQQLLS